MIPDYVWGHGLLSSKQVSVKQVALGEAHTLVLMQTGAIFSFGWNEFG